MSNDTRILTEQDEEAFWALMSRPIRTVVLAKDVLAAASAGTQNPPDCKTQPPER